MVSLNVNISLIVKDNGYQLFFSHVFERQLLIDSVLLPAKEEAFELATRAHSSSTVICVVFNVLSDVSVPLPRLQCFRCWPCFIISLHFKFQNSSLHNFLQLFLSLKNFSIKLIRMISLVHEHLLHIHYVVT